MGDRQTLFQEPEHSLWDIYKKNRLIKKRPFNFYVTIIFSLLLVLYVFLTKESISELAGKVYTWTDFGFNFIVAILGFLIAGFTIFATVGDKELYMFMGATEKEPGLSNLKYSFFAFMNVFIVYIVVGFVFLIIKLFATSNGLLQVLSSYLITNYGQFKEYVAKIAVVLVGTSIIYIFLILKSFIFNIYHIVIIMVQVREATYNDDVKELLEQLKTKNYTEKDG